MQKKIQVMGTLRVKSHSEYVSHHCKQALIIGASA